MKDITGFERSVLELATKGESPIMRALQLQIPMTRVVSRESTEVGFYTYLSVDAACPPIPEMQDFAISDVYGRHRGLEHGAGFNVFIRRGCLDVLEGFTFDGPWPADVGEFTLAYEEEPRRPEVMGPDVSRAGPGTD